MYYFPTIIFKYFLTVCTDNPDRLDISFLETPSPTICARSSRYRSNLLGCPSFTPWAFFLARADLVFSEIFSLCSLAQQPLQLVLDDASAGDAQHPRRPVGEPENEVAPAGFVAPQGRLHPGKGNAAIHHAAPSDAPEVNLALVESKPTPYPLSAYMVQATRYQFFLLHHKNTGGPL